MKNLNSTVNIFSLRKIHLLIYDLSFYHSIEYLKQSNFGENSVIYFDGRGELDDH